MRRRVAVTGLGLVTPVGNDAPATWDALVAGKSGAGPITRFDPARLRVKFACEVKQFDAGLYLDKKEIRRFDLYSQFAMGAASQALADAGLKDLATVDSTRTGVIIGTGTGGIMTFEDQCRTYLEKGPDRVSPFFVPMHMPNGASALVSMRWGAKGPNYGISSACATSGHSVGEAMRLIQHGYADLMIAGGSEAAITPLAVASFFFLALQARHVADRNADDLEEQHLLRLTRTEIEDALDSGQFKALPWAAIVALALRHL